MKILFLSTWFPDPPDNGSKLRAFHLLAALSKAHSVTAVAFQPDKARSETVGELVKRDDCEVWAVAGDPFRYTRLPTIFRYLSPIPLSHWPNRMMKQTVAQLNATQRWDAIVAVQLPVAQYAFQMPHVPGIVDIDTSLSFQLYDQLLQQVSTIRRIRNWISWQKAQTHTQRMLRPFRVCTVSSPVERPYIERLVERQKCQVEVVPNGVDCNHNRLSRTDGNPNTLVFNGSLTYYANLDAMQYFLAEVYPIIRHDVPTAKMIITGSVQNVDLVGLGLDESVHLTGYVDDVRPVVASSSVCVVPLRLGGGTRLKILEAMALGIPVVTTTKGAEGLDVKDHEHLLLADHPQAFAKQVIKLLTDSALRQRLTHNARQLVVTRYDWRQIGARFVSLVEEVAAEGP